MARPAVVFVVWGILGCGGHALSSDGGGAGSGGGGTAGPSAGGAGGVPSGDAAGGAGAGGVSASGAAGVSASGAAGTPASDGGGAGAPQASGGGAGAPAVQVPRIACNVDCPDGPCVVRAGLPPTVIAAAPPGDHVGALATGANALYYGTIARDFYTAGELRQAPLAGGPSSLLVSGVAVASIRIDLQGTIYFVADEARSSATRLWSFAGAGPAKVSDVNDYGMVAVPTHDGQVWVEKAELMGGFIAWHDPDGSFSRVAELKGTPHGFALDGTNLYWADGDGPSHISTIRTDDGNVDEYGFVMTTATDVLASPIAAGADLYFLHAHAPGDCQGSVMVMPTAGGQPILVSLGHSGSDVSSLAVDGGFVYWTTPDAGGLVFRAARGGGTPEVIATEQAGARAVAAGAGRVYWIAVGAGGDEVRAVAP